MRLVLADTVPITHGGGYERFLLQFGRLAALRGHQVVLLTPRRRTGVRLGRSLGVRIESALSEEFVTNEAHPARLMQATLQEARAVIEGADIVYLKNEPQELILALLLRGRRPKLIVGVHSATEGRPGLSGRLRASMYRSSMYRVVAQRASAFHALQDYQARYLEDEIGIPSSRIWLVPNGVDLERFAPRTARQETGTFRILLSGRLELQKGTDVFLRSLERIGLQTRPISVTVAGDGPLRPMVKRAAAASPSISFVGYVSEPASLYASHDLLVAPSRWEVFPLVPCEALACGLPVVLSDIPANRVFQGSDAVSTSRTDDAEDLAKAIVNRFDFWLNSPDDYHTLRPEGRRFAEEHLDQRKTFDALIRHVEDANGAA